MKNLKEMKKLKLGFLILILLFLNSCSLNTNFETKNKITKKGKFSFLVEEKVYTGLLKIEKLDILKKTKSVGIEISKAKI